MKEFCGNALLVCLTGMVMTASIAFILGVVLIAINFVVDTKKKIKEG